MVEKIKPFVELGSTGLKRYHGYIDEEFLRELKGTRAVKVYEEMESNDSIVGAILFAIRMLIRQVEWRAKPADDNDTARDNADFLESCLDDMSSSWTSVISEILSFLTYGWSYHEVVYKQRRGENRDPSKRSKYDDGKIGWRKLPIRAQNTLDRWDFDDEGGIRGMMQVPPPDYKPRYIPIEKALLFRTTSYKGNPEGRSALRNAYRSWYLKRMIENIEAIGIERDLAGLPVAWVPPEILNTTADSASVAVRTEVENVVKNIRRDEQEGLLFPLAYDEKGNKLYDLTLLSTGGRRQFDTTNIINRYNQQIAMTVLADFILLGHEKVGSFALSSSKTSIFTTALDAWLYEISDVFNRFAIPRLFQLNGIKTDLPELVYGDVESVDLSELGDFITKLSNAGAPLFPDKELENYLRRQAALPETQEAE